MSACMPAPPEQSEPDVYKRQTFHNGRMVGLDIVTAVVSLRSMLDDARVPDMCSAKPVSYTHLDVYKRQA